MSKGFYTRAARRVWSATAGVFGVGSKRQRGLELTRAADRERDSGNWHAAAELYPKALELLPHREDLAIQAGNCLKEAGVLDRAIAFYDRVKSPAQRPEALFQKGDALQRMGEVVAAEAAFKAAADEGHLMSAERIGSLTTRGATEFPVLNAPISEREVLNRLFSPGDATRQWLGTLDRSTHRPAVGQHLAPGSPVTFDQVGWIKLNNKGREEPLLFGVVAVRARLMSDHRLTRVDLRVGREVVATAEPSLVSHQGSSKWFHAVNLWFDCDRLRPCRTELTITGFDARGGTVAGHTVANIAQTPPGFEVDSSDSFVPSPVDDGDSVIADVLSRPAKVRSARREMLPGPIEEILAMRVDALGDLSATLPGLRRLRQIFPEAKITALVSPALMDIVNASALCDHVLGLTLVYDHTSERRYLEETEEGRIRDLLDEHSFDVAIDLCPGPETRPLLRMVNAKYLVGFHPRQFEYLDFGIDIFSRDKVNQLVTFSHATHILALVEALAVALRPAQAIVARRADDRNLLDSYGVAAGNYVVVHSGARHAINMWPVENFIALSGRIMDELGLSVVFFSDASTVPQASSGTRAGAKIIYPGQVPIDHLDGLIASCRFMVGNDSGPKHLASVRGIPTVSIHVNRLNWREWGQDGQGIIISKRVPCCGCGLNNVALCATGVACITSITVDEVFDAIVNRVRPGDELNAACGEPPLLH